jgi:hypothetical protein
MAIRMRFMPGVGLRWVMKNGGGGGGRDLRRGLWFWDCSVNGGLCGFTVPPGGRHLFLLVGRVPLSGGWASTGDDLDVGTPAPCCWDFLEVSNGIKIFNGIKRNQLV